MCPKASEKMQTPTDSVMLAAALNQSPVLTMANVSRVNDENVVKPPQIPTMRKRRRFSEIPSRPPEMAKVPTKPIMKQPITLTAIVPQGKVPLTFRVRRVSP